mmetsp:Transcript_33515/g.72407  ORF Transcript_33515/g.72407 Transcript_33515/m.72407 type:complete len:313 (-) Transcript_33515:204-1142(-)
MVEIILHHDVGPLQVRLHMLLVGGENRLEDAVFVQVLAPRGLGLLQVPEHALDEVVVDAAHNGDPHVEVLCETLVQGKGAFDDDDGAVRGLERAEADALALLQVEERRVRVLALENVVQIRLQQRRVEGLKSLQILVFRLDALGGVEVVLQGHHGAPDHAGYLVGQAGLPGAPGAPDPDHHLALSAALLGLHLAQVLDGAHREHEALVEGERLGNRRERLAAAMAALLREELLQERLVRGVQAEVLPFVRRGHYLKVELMVLLVVVLRAEVPTRVHGGVHPAAKTQTPLLVARGQSARRWRSRAGLRIDARR